jgi:glycosyltransferase involved in cell wall biosynthesis
VKLVLGTNIWSHYQGELAAELVRVIGTDNFRMALFEDTPPERRALGWLEHEQVPWIIGPPKNPEEARHLEDLCLSADVMIFGACDWRILEARNQATKLTLFQAERLLKEPHHKWRMLNPRYANGVQRFRERVKSPYVQALTVGHFAPDDLRTLGVLEGRMWRWGYFASVPPLMQPHRPKGELDILWAGRFLKWKRVDTLLKAIARIYQKPWFGNVRMIGVGDDLPRMQMMAQRLRLPKEKVQFLGAVSPPKVREWMNQSDAFVLSSNRGEGWGVVANEAMSEGCVMVANEEAGASKELIKHNKNGLLFHDGNASQLACHLEALGTDRMLLERLRTAAKSSMDRLWNPREAALRLTSLSESLLVGKPSSYSEGPCEHVG